MAIKIQGKTEVPTLKGNGFSAHLGDPLVMAQPQIKGAVHVGGSSAKLGLKDEAVEGYSPPIPEAQLHKLHVSGERKIMLENYGGPKYESASIHVGISIPCTKDTLEDAFEWGSTWVSNKIEEVLEKAKAGK